jgi:hypothetical protein
MKNELLLKCCSTCKIEKSVDLFCNVKTNIDGKSYRCKSCYKSIRELNKDALKNYAKIYREKNKQYIKNYSKTEKFKQSIKKYQKTKTYKISKSQYDKSDNNKNNRRIRYKKYIGNLHNHYVRQNLTHRGFTIEQINNNPDLIEVQKQLIKIKRLCKI